MDDIQKSVSESLDGFNQELFPFLPYILQDLWEIGADPRTMLSLISENIGERPLKIADLGCGKGAVSIKIAGTFECDVLGIDAMPAFIDDARQRAAQHGVSETCFFELGDIRKRVVDLQGFDVVILGAIGPVLGNLHETLSCLKRLLKRPGYVLLDDGYLEDDSASTYDRCLRKTAFYGQIAASGFEIVREVLVKKDDIAEYDQFVLDSIRKRVQELISQHPEKKELFLGYLKTQEDETGIIEDELKSGTWLLKIVD